MVCTFFSNEHCVYCQAFGTLHFCAFQDADMFWDFISLRPESTHQVCFLFGDRGIPDGFRHMNGKNLSYIYLRHTYRKIVIKIKTHKLE